MYHDTSFMIYITKLYRVAWALVLSYLLYLPLSAVGRLRFITFVAILFHAFYIFLLHMSPLYRLSW